MMRVGIGVVVNYTYFYINLKSIRYAKAIVATAMHNTHDKLFDKSLTKIKSILPRGG